MMKKMLNKIAILLLLLFATTSAQAQCSLKNTAFRGGEFLSYNLYFNWKFVWVKVGSASMSVVQSRYNGQPSYRASLLTRGNKRADNLFVLRDTLLSYTSTNLVPLYYRKAANEGGNYYVDEVFYSYPNNKMHVKQSQLTRHGERLSGQRTLGDCAYDMLNIFLRARSFDPSTWKKGYVYHFTMVDGHKTMPAKLKYQGKANVKADNGKKYRCLQLSYMEKEDGKDKKVVDFYVTDDANHVPVRLDMFLKFGSAKAFLTGIRGIRSAVAAEVR